MSDVVKCRWVLPDKVQLHIIEFTHGAISNKRTLTVNGQVQNRFRRKSRQTFEEFAVGDLKARITITKVDARNYEYQLMINETPFVEFRNAQNARFARWQTTEGGQKYDIVLDKTEVKLTVNKESCPSVYKFIGDHAAICFTVGSKSCKILSVTSGLQKFPYLHALYVERSQEPIFLDQHDGLFRSNLPV